MKAGIFERILEFDWSKLPNLLLLIFVFVISRLPLLNLGFGLDADAWRIANSAFDLRYHGVYHASRFPGYPLLEFLNAAVIQFGWVATNSLTMLVSLISVITFVQILKTLDCRKGGLLTITYAFLPLLWQNSTNTMDYMWALCFIMFVWLFLLNKKWVIAGLMMGLTLGSRPQAAVLIPPCLFLIYHHDRNVKDVARFLLASLFATGFLFSPLFLTYGLTFIRHYPAQTSIFQIGYQTIKQIGLPATLSLLILLITSRRGLRSMITEQNRNDMFILLCVILVLISFAATPYHLEYIILAIPFGLMLLYRIGSRPFVVLFSVLLLLHAFVTIGGFQHNVDGEITPRLIAQGAMSSNAGERKQQLVLAENLNQTSIDNHSIVIAGPWLPILAYLDDEVSSTVGVKKMYDSNRPGAGVWNFQRDISYRYLLHLDEVKALKAKNYRIYYITRVREFTEDIHGYDLDDYGAVYLSV
ncbi:hypothetical protein AMJ83_04045 [candidate division WOR_3 bacterium SM23_42]|uniref:Uncharacterized protein n=1 Tax=candidate division WOR_3 bacterium SM23_42 TaxID=1703779 RepID=A0A0S8FWX7_UNCW3|nr:MAG: hypothetical protein AMJ83_04045 [candidate division WOR_3 bacterium SM23_42]